MAAKNDKVILALKKQIEDKKKTLSSSERFTPITNCSLELDGCRMNLHAVSRGHVIEALVKLNAYRASAEQLDLLVEYTISGYSVDDWIADLKAKLAHLNRKTELDKLKAMETRLTELLSEDKKVELEVEKIASQL